MTMDSQYCTVALSFAQYYSSAHVVLVYKQVGE